MILTLDRIEGEVAILFDEEGNQQEMELSVFADPPKDGDVYDYDPDLDACPVLRTDLTKTKKERAISRLAALFARFKKR